MIYGSIINHLPSILGYSVCFLVDYIGFIMVALSIEIAALRTFAVVSVGKLLIVIFNQWNFFLD